MLTTHKPFLSLTAADLMTPDVITIPEHLSLRAAARMLERSQITGAPVVNEAGACVGVLSASDFVRWAHRGKVPMPAPTAGCVCSDWQMVEPEDLPADEACGCMTADPVTAGPETPITDLARHMLDAHIHRVVIVDAQSRPIGIVSSTDILAAVAYAEFPR
jgi:CBS-domain-containing membrane protein